MSGCGYSGAQQLADFILLVREVKRELHSAQGDPFLAYRGPFVPNALTRPDGLVPDPKALETLGVGEGEKYFGG
ncbi:hypothetical protein DQW77_15670 [Roseovarius sp. TE539]|nr:hypothetical protein DQW77_15670 [Roseovarius sp. TE539]